MPKDYIRYKLTGKFQTEVSDASGTNLFDVTNRCWSKEILDILDINENIMPEVFESVDISGNITTVASKVTGLATNTIVCMGASDNAAAAVGTGVVENGKALTTIGTSGVIFVHTDKVCIDYLGSVHTFCHAVPNAWTTMSCTLSAGMSLKWFKDNFYINEVETAKYLNKDIYEFINDGVKNIGIGANNLIYLPYLMGERSPILNPKARATFLGLSLTHNKYHMTRAIMEGVMYSQKHCLDIMTKMGIKFDYMYACGGGAKSEIWTNMMSDIYNTIVLKNENEEGPALGVAILSSIACGIYKDINTACSRFIETSKTILPNKNNYNEYMKFYNIYKNLYTSLEDSFENLYYIGCPF